MKHIAATALLVVFMAGCTPLIDQHRDVAIVGDYRQFAENVLLNGEKKILFFFASSCSVCEDTDADLRDWYATEHIPLPTYRIDTDTQPELMQRYHISVPHAFVLVDGSGEEVVTVSHPSTAQLKRLLYGNMEDATNAGE
ncbi:thioredoxin family protein [Candidatus Peribacteria bacterium]|nr:thioredoxin family protein [Candidatus Peribacteria bacterium]